MRDADHPFDAIAHATRGETVRLTAAPNAVLIMPEPPPGHVVVTLDPDALAVLDHLRHIRARYGKDADSQSITAMLAPLLDQIPACLTCMDTGEHAVDQDRGWCKCPAGSAAREG
jgi:hypothetical protein